MWGIASGVGLSVLSLEAYGHSTEMSVCLAAIADAALLGAWMGGLWAAGPPVGVCFSKEVHGEYVMGG